VDALLRKYVVSEWYYQNSSSLT